MNKMIKNEMKLEFLSKSNNEGFARVVVACFASQIDPTIEEIADIKTAVSEAVTNAIIHAYENKEGIVTLFCVPMYTSKSGLERSGMGFTIMESFMDNLKVESIVGLGTKITMKKKINTKEVSLESSTYEIK